MPIPGTVQLPNYPITPLPNFLGSFLWHHDGGCGLKRLAGVGGYRHQQGFLAINQVAGVEGGKLEAVTVSDGVCRAGLDAITAEDAAVVVDVIDLGIAFGAADAVLFRVLGGFDINAIR